MIKNDDVKTKEDLIRFIKINMCICEYKSLKIGEGLGICFDNLNLPFDSYMVEYIDEPIDENIYMWSLVYGEDCENIHISSHYFDNIHDLKCDLISFLEKL